MALLVTLGEMGLLWGPLIPALLPLTLFAVFSNFVLYRVGVCWHGAHVTPNDDARLSRVYHYVSLGCFCIFASWYCWETDMHGSRLMLCFTAALSCYVLYATRQRIFFPKSGSLKVPDDVGVELVNLNKTQSSASSFKVAPVDSTTSTHGE